MGHTEVLIAGETSGSQPVSLLVDSDGTLHVTGVVTGTVTTKETRSATGTQSSTAGSASSVTVLAANANRLGATITNDSTSVCYVKFGATASATSYAYRLVAYAICDVPFGYTGVIDAIWVTATGSARVTEFTA